MENDKLEIIITKENDGDRIYYIAESTKFELSRDGNTPIEAVNKLLTAVDEVMVMKYRYFGISNSS